MKIARIALAVLLFAATTWLQAQSAQKPLDQFRTLDGTWTGQARDGSPLKITFRETAGGSAILSEIEGHGHGSMVSMFHADNGRLMMTHYCSAGNQPRMVASVAPDGRTFTFDFLDATNLATPDAGHMQKVVFTIADADHHTEEWVFADHGKEHRELFILQRAK